MKTIDQIVNDHGCEIGPGPTGAVLTVQRFHQQGDRADDVRLAECRSALDAAGHHVRWHRLTGVPPIGTPIESPDGVALPGRVRLPWDPK